MVGLSTKGRRFLTPYHCPGNTYGNRAVHGLYRAPIMPLIHRYYAITGRLLHGTRSRDMNARNEMDAEQAGEVRALRSQLAELKEQVRAATAMSDQKGRLEHALRERVKELNCLYRITETVDRYDGSLDELLQGIADGLPCSWQYPDIACARIVFGEREYATGGFQRSPWRQAQELVVSGKGAGVVEVYYLTEMVTVDEGPFLKEERLLINAVTERTGKIIERVHARQQLQTERRALEESNVALRQVMARIRDERAEIGKAVQSNVEKIIMPIVDAIADVVSPEMKGYADLLRRSLEDIVSPFVDELSTAFASLTPAETRICDMIRRGLTTKEIARLQTISTATVRHHRERIRRKLGLANKKINLTSYLNAFRHGQASTPGRTPVKGGAEP